MRNAKEITVLVPTDTHALMRVWADQRGMKLKEIPNLWAELAQVTTEKQRQLAYQRYVARRRPANA